MYIHRLCICVFLCYIGRQSYLAHYLSRPRYLEVFKKGIKQNIDFLYILFPFYFATVSLSLGCRLSILLFGGERYSDHYFLLPLRVPYAVANMPWAGLFLVWRILSSHLRYSPMVFLPLPHCTLCSCLNQCILIPW